VVLRNTSWDFYQRFLQEVGDQNLRVTYSNGAMEINSPLPISEKLKKAIAQMVEIITLELEISRASMGSTTYFDDTIEKGLEPDECYYFENEPFVRGKDRINLQSDPPPDLAIEVDISHRSIDRESLYAASRVPELWRCDGRSIECLVLDSSGAYQPSLRSRCLPMILMEQLNGFVARLRSEDEVTVMRSFRDWVRQLPPAG
jgi:Uma2 family endonuclease